MANLGNEQNFSKKTVDLADGRRLIYYDFSAAKPTENQTASQQLQKRKEQ